MRTQTIKHSRRTRGTILIIALAVLFTLGILGLLFLRIVAGSTISALVGSERSIANELSKAGVRYSFAQLRFSEDGADWRPQPPSPVPADVDPLRPPGLGPNSDPELPTATNPDPDYYWLRRQVDPALNDPNDRGGPDGLGCYTRLNYRNGRALIRVRYAASGLHLFSGQAAKAITESGKLRSYTLVEAAGRPGAFNVLDPTAVRKPDIQRARQLSAIASIGIIESARYITNKANRDQAVELGTPTDFGATYNATPVQVPMIVGGTSAQAPVGLYPGGQITLGGPIYVNAPLRVHGDLRVFLNADLGDQINVWGDLEFADQTSTLSIARINEQGGSEIVTPVSAFPSNSPNFTTGGGVLRDIRELPDAQGYARSVPRKEAPLIDEEDPSSQQFRYRLATRSSGIVVGTPGGQFNLGRLGYGRGVYVENFEDKADDTDDGSFTQRYDWMNPNNGHPNSRWDGPLYTPDGVQVLMYAERNNGSPEVGGMWMKRNARVRPNIPPDTWRDYTGGNTNSYLLQFKFGYGNDGLLHIINGLTPGVATFATPTLSDFDRGPVFNGVVMAEGNLRVRGVIPFDTQITFVSMETAYIEGSIIKGNSLSTCAVLAKDNTVLNTSQLFNPLLPAERLTDNGDPASPWGVRITGQGKEAKFFAQFINNPLTGNSWLADYTFPQGGQTIAPGMFVAQAGGTATGGNGFYNLLINAFSNPNVNNAAYLFAAQNPPNAASPFFPAQDPIPTWGMAYTGQILPNFEKRSYQFYPTAGHGNYALALNGSEEEFTIKKDETIAPPGGNQEVVLSRFALQPYDVRIEAVLYAQEGSFFVLPGAWFNWNPNDRRDNFVSAADRFAQFGATAEYPFYGEPLNIRITVVGSVSENFPPAMGDQEEWLRKWGWMPVEYGGSGIRIPNQHNPNNSATYVPNLFINYDPVLITGRVGGSFDPTTAASIRFDRFGRELPPMPKLPVGTNLFYFGEVNP